MKRNEAQKIMDRFTKDPCWEYGLGLQGPSGGLRAEYVDVGLSVAQVKDLAQQYFNYNPDIIDNTPRHNETIVDLP